MRPGGHRPHASEQLAPGTPARKPSVLTSPSRSHMKFSQPSSGGASGMNSQSAPEARADTSARYLEKQEGQGFQWVVGCSPAPRSKPAHGRHGSESHPAPNQDSPHPELSILQCEVSTCCVPGSVEGLHPHCYSPTAPPPLTRAAPPYPQCRPITSSTKVLWWLWTRNGVEGVSAAPRGALCTARPGLAQAASGHGSRTTLPTAPALPRKCPSDPTDSGAAEGQTAHPTPRAAGSLPALGSPPAFGPVSTDLLPRLRATHLAWVWRSLARSLSNP